MNKGNYNYPPSSPSYREHLPFFPQSPRSLLSPQSPRSPFSPQSPIKSHIRLNQGFQRRNSSSSIYSQTTDVSSKSLSSILTKNKKNDFLEYLIILLDDNYKSSFMFNSIYDNLLKQNKYFNDNLTIINKKDITKSNKYLIDGMANTQELYIKLPKENLYVLSSQFHNRYLNSKINELISIFSVLKAKRIKVSIQSEKENNFKLNINAGVNVNGVNIKAGAENSKNTNKNLQSDWDLEFFQNSNGSNSGNGNNGGNTKININEFADDKRFYYLPKESEWIDAIRNRVSQNVCSDKFTYSYTDTNDIKYKAFTNLKLFTIKCEYNNKQFENLKINYEIEYYPLDTVIIENKFNKSNNNDNNVIIINNNKGEKENMNILDYVNDFFTNIF